MKAGAQDYVMKNNLTRLCPAIERELREVEVRRERERAEATVEHQAHYDLLTNLPNRTTFRDRLTVALAQAVNAGGGTAAAAVGQGKFAAIAMDEQLCARSEFH